MSDLTPDGDLTSNARVAIRSFPLQHVPTVSDLECDMLREWASHCVDAENGARLNRLVTVLEASAGSMSEI